MTSAAPPIAVAIVTGFDDPAARSAKPEPRVTPTTSQTNPTDGRSAARAEQLAAADARAAVRPEDHRSRERREDRYGDGDDNREDNRTPGVDRKSDGDHRRCG